MSSGGYTITDPWGTYFVSFAGVEWVDVFTRKKYRDVLIESLSIAGKRKYIHKSPVEAGIVEKAEEYIYSSARDY